MTTEQEKLGVLIDELESLAVGLHISVSAEFHLKQLKEILPEKVEAFKKPHPPAIPHEFAFLK